MTSSGAIFPDPNAFVSVVRVSLHITAATIWVGGQIVLAGLVGTVRKLDPVNGPRAAANRYNLLAWPAYGVLVFTGIWNLLSMYSFPHPATELKISAVVISGLGALLHLRANNNKALLAIGGAASSLGAVAALILGVWLRQGG